MQLMNPTSPVQHHLTTPPISGILFTVGTGVQRARGGLPAARAHSCGCRAAAFSLCIAHWPALLFWPCSPAHPPSTPPQALGAAARRLVSCRKVKPAMNGGPAPTACLAANFLLQNDDAVEEDGWFRYAQGPLPLAGISCARACMHHCRTCRSWDSPQFGSAPHWPALQHCLPVPRCRRALKVPAISIAPCLQELPPQRRWVPMLPSEPAPGPGFEPLQGYCNTRPPTPAFAAT